MTSWPFFTPRKTRMRMNLDHVDSGHFVVTWERRSLRIRLLVIGRKPDCKYASNKGMPPTKVCMSSVLQVQQLYTAGIPLLEAYLQSSFLPMTSNRIRKERLSQVTTKWPLSTRSRFIRMRVFCGVKNGRFVT